jgi:hypothetical protein
MYLRMVKERAFDVSPLLRQLAAHPQCWDGVRLRTEHPKSPHRETSDIWVRYNPLENYHGNMQDFNAEHTPDWYPICEELPAARELAEAVSADQQALQIGMVLITRIPPGKQVYPHVDGGWHARTFEKFALTIKADDEQAFFFENEYLVTHPGDLFWFDNSQPHWVSNNSDEDRITLIVCLRRN